MVLGCFLFCWQEMEGLLLNCLANCPNECVTVEGRAWVCSEAFSFLELRLSKVEEGRD